MKKTAKPKPKSTTPIQIRVENELLRQVDELGKKNGGIDRSAICAIALARIVKSGL